MTRRQADLALLLATALWGTSFVAVKSALADATPFAFLTVRFGIAALALAPGTRFRPRPAGRELSGGAVLGALVAVGFIAQTAGLVITTPSRSAFIVAVSSVLAPVIALALLGERPRWLTAAALALATLGIYLLTAPDAGGLNRGDLLTLVCAVSFGGQLFERPHIHWTPRFAGALLYTVLFASTICFVLQMRAQREMSTARAALIFCFEPLFAAVTSWLILGERLSLLQWSGGALILAGMVLAEMPGAKGLRG